MGRAFDDGPDPFRDLAGALHAEGPHPGLADQLDLFGRFVGSWDIEWHGTDARGRPASLALVAAGVAVVQLVPPFRIPGGSRLLGGVLTGVGALVAATAFPRWRRNQRAMRAGRPLPASPVPPLLGIGLALLAVAAFALVVLAGGPG